MRKLFILWAVIVIAGITGWVMNIFKLVQCSFDTIDAEIDSSNHWNFHGSSWKRSWIYWTLVRMKLFMNGGMEKIIALKRMLKDSGKYFPELTPAIQKELHKAQHERDCRLVYGRAKLLQRKILGKNNKVSKEKIVFIGGEK